MSKTDKLINAVYKDLVKKAEQKKQPPSYVHYDTPAQTWHQQGVTSTIVNQPILSGSALTLSHVQNQALAAQQAGIQQDQYLAAHQEHLNTLTPAGIDLINTYNDNEDEE